LNGGVVTAYHGSVAARGGLPGADEENATEDQGDAEWRATR
jgi:hypothetical protein